ncbi:MAG: hypothetical protein B1H04_00605 [Planctomycetales bacterium 4484_123]|nr:MAG: hypothetical protein B1H04_00605 [Planctomycetales bacterium 4484_123]
MKTANIACAVILAAGTVAVLGDEEPTGPKIVMKNWSKAGNFEMTVNIKLDQDVVVNGQPQPRQHVIQTMVVGLNVSRTDAQGARTIEVSYKRIKQKMQFGTVEKSFDSAAPKAAQDPLLAKAFAPILRAKISVVVGADGKVRSIRGLEQLWKDMAAGDPRAAQMIEVMKKQFGDQLIGQVIGQNSQITPAGGVRVGESWTKQTKIALPFVGQMSVNQQFRLKGLRFSAAGKVAEVDFKATVKSADAKAVQLGPVTMNFEKLNLTQVGQMEYNVDQGLFVSLRVNQTNAMQMSGQAPDGQPTKVTIDQKMTMTSTVRQAPPEATTKAATTRLAK